MKHFTGWASAEEFVVWEEQSEERDSAAVLAAHQALRVRRATVRLPLWVFIAAGCAFGLSFAWAVLQVAELIAGWLVALLPNLR